MLLVQLVQQRVGVPGHGGKSRAAPPAPSAPAPAVLDRAVPPAGVVRVLLQRVLRVVHQHVGPAGQRRSPRSIRGSCGKSAHAERRLVVGQIAPRRPVPRRCGSRRVGPGWQTSAARTRIRRRVNRPSVTSCRSTGRAGPAAAPGRAAATSSARAGRAGSSCASRPPDVDRPPGRTAARRSPRPWMWSMCRWVSSRSTRLIVGRRSRAQRGGCPCPRRAPAACRPAAHLHAGGVAAVAHRLRPRARERPARAPERTFTARPPPRTSPPPPGGARPGRSAGRPSRR